MLKDETKWIFLRDSKDLNSTKYCWTPTLDQVPPQSSVWNRKLRQQNFRGNEIQESTNGNKTEPRNRSILLLLYRHLLFFYSCKISKNLLVHRKRAPAAAGEFRSRQVNFFAISSSPQQSDGRSAVSCFLPPLLLVVIVVFLFRGSVQRHSQERSDLWFFYLFVFKVLFIVFETFFLFF